MTALYIVGVFGLAFGPTLLIVVLLSIRSALRGRYADRIGRDDIRDVTPVRAPLAIEAATYRHADVDAARILAATELPRFPFPKGGRW